MMPRTVKLFLALCTAYSLWLVWANMGFLLFPSPQRLQNLAKLGANLQAIAERADMLAGGIRALIALALFLTFALLAGLKRKAWARWALVALFVTTIFVVFIQAGILLMLLPATIRSPNLAWESAVRTWLGVWSHWQAWAVLALKLAMIATLFSPGSKTWFRRTEGCSPAPSQKL